MNEDQITALAREYAEFTDLSPVDKKNVSRICKCFLEYTLRRYCLVEKSKVAIKYKNIKRLEEDATAFGFERHISNARTVKSLIESLFPEIEKEVEE